MDPDADLALLLRDPWRRAAAPTDTSALSGSAVLALQGPKTTDLIGCLLAGPEALS